MTAEQIKRNGFLGTIRDDIASVLERDPAARSKLEVAVVYSLSLIHI